jgi:hypothetical protein
MGSESFRGRLSSFLNKYLSRLTRSKLAFSLPSLRREEVCDPIASSLEKEPQDL